MTENMINQKVRKISYKLYLSMQGLIFVVGLGVLIWNVIAAIHDLRVSTKGKECVSSVVGREVFDWYNEKLGPERWDDSLETHVKGLDHPSKKYALQELLKRKCSDYVHMTIYEHSGDVGVYTKNYMDGYPATLQERAGYIGLTVGITVGIMALLFGLMKWTTWLLRD